MSEELKPCPFCGDVPELPSGDGTQYEIECGGCGQAMATVQICDLMTRAERVTGSFADHRYGEKFIERAKLEAIERWNTRDQQSSQGGEAVAWLVQSKNHTDVFELAEPNEKATNPTHWTDAFPVYTCPAATVPARSIVVPVELLEQWANDLALHGVGDIDTAQQIDALLKGGRP